jgi:hypothetical protein
MIKETRTSGTEAYSAVGGKAKLIAEMQQRTTNNIYEKDNIDIVLIAVSTLIIISSFTYLFFV